MNINPSPPKGWRNLRLRFVLDFPKKTEIAGLSESMGVSFVPMESIGPNGGLNLEQTREMSEVQNGYTYFRDGDVLIAKITPCFENGKGALAEGLHNGIGFGTTEVHSLRPRQGVNSRYLFYLTCTHQFRRLGEGWMYGAGGQKRVPEQFIKDLVHPIPPYEIQINIADFLDVETARIDELISKKQRLIELLGEKRMESLDAIVDTAPSISITGSWTVRHLIQTRKLEIQDGNHGELHPTAEDYTAIGIPFLMANDVRNGKADLTGCKFIGEEVARSLRIGYARAKDVLLTHKGTIGEVALLPSELSFPFVMLTPQVTYYRSLVPHDLSPEYLVLFMSSSRLRKYESGGLMGLPERCL